MTDGKLTCKNCGLELSESDDYEFLYEGEEDSPAVHSDMMDCISGLKALVRVYEERTSHV